MQEIIKKLKELTGREFIQLTERGNKAINIALDLAVQLEKTTVLIPDQGGWMYYRKAPRKFDLEIREVKTNNGLIDLEDLENKADENSVLLTCSMPGYTAIDDMEEIMKICSKKGCLLVNDISGSIGTEAAKIGHLLIGSFGKWKPLNLEYGGLIATNEEKFYQDFDASYFDETKYEALLQKLEELDERLFNFQLKRSKIIHDLSKFKIIHKDAEGINVIIKFKTPKERERLIKYCDKNKLEYTECPRYIRVNEDAISVEVKRL